MWKNYFVSLTKKHRFIWLVCIIVAVSYTIFYYELILTYRYTYNNVTYLHSGIVSRVQAWNRSLIHTYNYKLLLSPTKICQEKDKSVLIIVCSSVVNKNARNAIRETWSSEASDFGIAVYFLLGTSSDIKDEEVKEEANTFGDIIQYNFTDRYENLTIKSVHLLKWAKDNCIKSNYIMKVDDDVFVNLQNLHNYIKSIGKEDQADLFGLVLTNSRPYRDKFSKFYMPLRDYPSDVYPTYLSGVGYIIRRNAISSLYETSIKLPFFRFEDIFITGMCSRELKLKLKSVNNLHFSGIKIENCFFEKKVAVHKVSEVEMYEGWKQCLTCRNQKFQEKL